MVAMMMMLLMAMTFLVVMMLELKHYVIPMQTVSEPLIGPVMFVIQV